MDDFTPFLQIIHISDLHVTDPRSANAASTRAAIRKTKRVPLLKGISADIEDGVGPHDPLAIGLFKEFLTDIVTDPAWKDCKNWLVDTGDLTSLGDKRSFALGQEYLAELTGICPEHISIYGNHDAWPGKLPLMVTEPELAAQTTALSLLNYTVGAIRLALQTPIPNGNGKVELYFVDSVIHDRWNNLRALGKVPDSQLKAFEATVDGNYHAGKRDFRILAVHHPVHFPAPRPRFSMSMKNDREVGAALGERSPRGAYPLAHLVLSGHTHALFPEHGKLPVQPSLCVHPDLGPDQCQLVAGTLMQLDRYQKRSGWPHQCELLRLYYSPGDDSVLLVERFLVARQTGDRYRGTGIGPYRFVPLGNKLEEEITFTLW
jgi:Calcineurin-like phosphoesterase